MRTVYCQICGHGRSGVACSRSALVHLEALVAQLDAILEAAVEWMKEERRTARRYGSGYSSVRPLSRIINLARRSAVSFGDEEVEHETFQDATVKKTTDAALLVEIEDQQVWIPRRLVSDEGEVTGESEVGDSGTLVIPLWLAEDRELA